MLFDTFKVQSLTKVDLYFFLSAQMVEQMIPILQSLRFESSFTLTQKYIFLLYSKNVIKGYEIEWGLNPHGYLPKFLLCPAGRADGEVLRSKFWIVNVNDPVLFFFSNDRGLHALAGRVFDSKISRSEVWILMKVDQKLLF